jgi:hypothetical protein
VKESIENKFTNIKERVVQIAEKQDVSKERFFFSIGMTSANFRGKAKDTPLNSKAIVNIITKYPEVDLYWLLMGEKERTGDVVNESELEYHKPNTTCEEKDEMILLLKSQIKDLKADKEDLKKLLGLAQKK